jgi:hypothetical protein
MVRKGKNSGSIGDFAFNDSDPEKMTTTSICMITITVSDDDPYSGRLNKKCKVN